MSEREKTQLKREIMALILTWTVTAGLIYSFFEVNTGSEWFGFFSLFELFRFAVYCVLLWTLWQTYHADARTGNFEGLYAWVGWAVLILGFIWIGQVFPYRNDYSNIALPPGSVSKGIPY